jgi:hypothetical protein
MTYIAREETLAATAMPRALLVGMEVIFAGSRTRDRTKGEPGLVKKDIRSPGSDYLQPGTKEVLTVSYQPRGKTKKSSLLHLTSTE